MMFIYYYAMKGRNSMRKRIALIAGGENTRKSLKKQLEDYIGDQALIETYNTEEGINSKINTDLAIITSPLIYNDAIDHINKNCHIIVSRRVLNISEIERILLIPSGEKVLFVNDAKETALECIDWLIRLGIKHINYIPYYPGCDCNEAIRNIQIAITADEVHLVPPHIDNIINMGTRIIDTTTIGEILKELGLFEDRWEFIAEKSMAKLIDLAKNMAIITQEKAEAYEQIKKVIDGVRDGILAFNENGLITVLNENLKYLLGIKRTNMIGRNIKEIVNDKEILEYLLYGNQDDTRTFQYKGTELNVTRFNIKREGSIIATFKNAKDEKEIEKQQRRELYNKGYYGKYTFDDIIGNSQKTEKVKVISKKLALADLTVLIEGESGTGKELFASAIHNESQRKNKSFIAVNFSSIAENLVESELFGYEEGAFTGAIKGGKAGLFEQANGGTIFLDEIGDISLKVQSRLLRVLQEKEIMRIGGNKIIPVDVRIIAATNQNLLLLVNNGAFRGDLYHRLKVLYLKVPSLRERSEDILPLVRYFMHQKGLEGIKINKEVLDKLENYPWYGNVRELRNTIEYMLAVCDKKTIVNDDLPQESFFQENEADETIKEAESIEVRGDYAVILKDLYEQMQVYGNGSRQRLADNSKKYGMALTEQMIRHRLDKLEALGYVKRGRGKSGTILTPYGIKRVKEIYL